MRHSKLLRVLALLLVAGGSFAVVAGGALGVLAYRYQDRFYPNVRVAGIDLSGRTQAEGLRLLQGRMDQYVARPVKVVVPDVSKPIPDNPTAYADQELATTAGGLGLYFPGHAAYDAAWAVGHGRQPRRWLAQVVQVLFGGYDGDLSYRVKPAGIQTFIDTAVVPKIGAPQPARIAVSGAEVSVQPPQPGFVVDQQELSRQLVQSLGTVADNDTAYLRAPVREADSPVTQQAVRPLADALSAIGSLKVSFAAAGFAAAPSREQLLSWVLPVQDGTGQVVLVVQKDAVARYLAQFKQLDQDKSLALAMGALAPLPSEPVATLAASKPLAISVAATPKQAPLAEADTPGLFPGKYVEVSLAQQKMYLFIGSSLQKVYRVSSGKASTPTPRGTFKIRSKSPRAYSAEYGLYMPYWQNFTDDAGTLPVGAYGLHELPEWPNGYKEGAGHLGTPVSDGCVRVGVGDAKELYDWTEIGTPVYIH